MNRAVKTLKDRPELSINIRAVSVDKLAWGVVSDASFANAYMVVTVREKREDSEGRELHLGGRNAEFVQRFGRTVWGRHPL